MTPPPRHSCCLFLSLLLPLIAAERSAIGYDFQVTARTEGYGYQLRRYERAGGLVFLNRRRITQYLGLRIFNLLDPGQQAYRPGSTDPPRLIYLNAMMRFYSDFGEYVRPLVERPELLDDRFELLYGALEGRNIAGYVDFTLGRQFDGELMDFFAYDGLRLRLNSPWGVFLETHVGIEVDRARPFSAAVFESDGVSGDEADEAVAPAFGVAAGVEDFHDFDLRVAYRGVASKAEIEAVEADGALSSQSLWGVDRELLFLSAGYRLPYLRTRLRFGGRYNLLVGLFDELQGVLSQNIGHQHVVQLEAARSQPHFDGDSIFNIFGIEPFTELAGRYAYQRTPFTIELRLGYRWFWVNEAVEDDEEDVAPGALSTAIAARWLAPTLQGGIALYYLEGQGGRRGGGDVDAAWQLWHWLAFDGRLSLIGSEDDAVLSARDEGVLLTFGFQIGAKVLFTKGVLLHLSLEDNISRLYESALRFMAVLDMEFNP